MALSFLDRELKLLIEIKQTFPDSEMVVYFATADQIQQLKDAGLSGISRRQRNEPVQRIDRVKNSL